MLCKKNNHVALVATIIRRCLIAIKSLQCNPVVSFRLTIAIYWADNKSPPHTPTPSIQEDLLLLRDSQLSVSLEARHHTTYTKATLGCNLLAFVDWGVIVESICCACRPSVYHHRIPGKLQPLRCWLLLLVGCFVQEVTTKRTGCVLHFVLYMSAVSIYLSIRVLAFRALASAGRTNED